MSIPGVTPGHAHPVHTYAFWILLSLLSGCLCVTQPRANTLAGPPEEADEFHFVVIGDAQFNSPETFNRIVDQTRRLRPAFVIQVGDLIEGYQNDLAQINSEWDRFARQIEPLAPIHYMAVPGNHDLYNANKRPDKKLEALFEARWGPLYFTFVYKNARFIGLNSDSTEGRNRIDGKQLAWLTQTLADNTAEHTFVFMHRPPLLMPNSDKLHKLFLKHGVSHVFYGHHHHYHHLNKDGIHYSMTNASGDSAHDLAIVGGFKQLLQVAVRGHEVDVAVIEADAVKPQDYVHPADNYDLFELKRNLVPKRLKLSPAADDQHFNLNIPIRNTSRRSVTFYIHCESADHRWLFDPPATEPVTIAAQDRKRLNLTAYFQTGRTPESMPVCQIRLPLQTRKGVWFNLDLQIDTEY